MRRNARTRNRATVIAWSAAMIAAAAVAWSLLPRELDGVPVSRTAEPDAPLAHKGDYLIPGPKAPPDFAARWVPLAPAVTVGAGLPGDRMPSIEGPSEPPEPPSSPVSEPARAEANQARMRLNRDACAARGMRREDTYRDNRWLSWRCVR